MPTRALIDLVHPSWAAALEPVAGTVSALGEFLREEVAAGRGYLPGGRARAACVRAPAGRRAGPHRRAGPLPHPPGTPWGCPSRWPPTCGPSPAACRTSTPRWPPTSASRRPATATSPPGRPRGAPAQPGAHRPAREPCQPPRQGLGERDRTGHLRPRAPWGPLVAVLWGRDARSLAPHLGDVPRIESAHPSPLSARSGFFGSRPFSRANELLRQQGAEPIDWSLP